MLGPDASRSPTTASARRSGARSGPTSPASTGPERPGLREVARRFGAVARELSVPRGPVRGEGPPPARHVAAQVEHHPYAAWAAVRRSGVAALEPLPGGRENATPLHVAVVIPPFGFGSGGHEVVFRLTEQLEALGHTVSLWIDDPFGVTETSASVLLRRIEDDFGVRLRAPLHLGLWDWFGADVAVATGWQTVWPLLGLRGVHARAYLVNDDEPAFYPRSVESELAGETYRQDLYCITGTRGCSSSCASATGRTAAGSTTRWRRRTRYDRLSAATTPSSSTRGPSRIGVPRRSRSWPSRS